MEGQVGVRSIDALKQFKTGMVRFQADAGAAMDQAEYSIKETNSRLQEARQARSDEVRSCERDLEEAIEARDDCESSGDDDDDCPDCREEQRAVRRAERQLHDAKEELRVADRAIRAMDEVVAAYRQEARKFRQQLSQDWAKAASQLDKEISHLQTYAGSSASPAPDVSGF